MRRPAFVEIDGKLRCWRDLVARRREQLRGMPPQYSRRCSS
jgi:hypothetical protein